MSELIIAVLFGLGLAYFATQNTMSVPISLGLYQVFNVPLYMIAFGSLLTGLLIAWIIHLVGTLGFLVSLRNRDSKIRKRELEMADLRKTIQDLQMENAQLKGNTPVMVEEKRGLEGQPEVSPRPNIFQRVRSSLFINRTLRQGY